MTTDKNSLSKIGKHRLSHNYNNCRFNLGEDLTKYIRSLCYQHKIPANVLIEYLLEFYDMKHLGLLIERIKAMYDRGLTAYEINQLSVLYTLLQAIDNRIGLH